MNHLVYRCFAFLLVNLKITNAFQVGLLLRTPVFSHGQLYVALSRARTEAGVKIWQPTSDEEKEKSENALEVQNLVLTTVLN